MKKFLVINFLLFLTACVYANELKIKVLDKDLNIPLEGVKIVVNEKNELTAATDENGNAVIILPDNVLKASITANLIGYEKKKIIIEDFTKEILMEISAGIIEGKELVIEGKKSEKSGQELGVSTVIDKNKLKTTAMKGRGEDVMSAIKILPGVSYSSRGSLNFSIRGSDTDGLTAMLDGFIVRYPYQWNNQYSIFSPNVTDSVTFSSGIFSAKNGLATSGIMEVNTITPNDGFKFTAMASLSDSEAYIQTPLWKNSGLLLGGRFIYYDLINLFTNPVARMSGLNSNSSSQFLRDGYFKWYWKPTDRFDWYINGCFASDGVTMNNQGNVDTTNQISRTFNMDYYNYDTFWNMGVKMLPVDNVFIHFFAGYEYLLNGSSGSSGNNGYQKYSDDFKTYYNNQRAANPGLPDITGIDGFTMDTETSSTSTQTLNSLQTRCDTDVTLNDKIIMSFGGGGIFDINDSSSYGKMFGIVNQGQTSYYQEVEFSSTAEEKKLLKTFIYLNFVFNIIPNVLKIEAGCRVDHTLMIGPDYYLNTYPVPGPRLNITYTPIKNLKYLDSMSFSAGVGLFSKSTDFSNITRSMGLSNFSITIPKTLTTVLGTELNFPLGIKIKLEGYYKYFYDRYYIDSQRSGNGMEYIVHTDGIGHAAGFDISFEKNISRWVDVTVAYSFTYIRLLNPTISSDDDMGGSGDPRGYWYYPSYHRFHNLNFVLNIKPVQWCAITPQLTFATGTPEQETESGTTRLSYVILPDGQVAEVDSTTGSSEYSDSLRSEYTLQFDLKVSFSSFFPRSRVGWEVFASVENLFGFIITSSGSSGSSRFSGQSGSTSASFVGQVPIPNIGIKINF